MRMKTKNPSFRAGISTSVAGFRKIVAGDARLLVANFREDLERVGRMAAVLFAGGATCLLGAFFALVFAYVGIARLADDAFAWTALGFAIFFGGAGAVAIGYAYARMRKMAFSHPRSWQLISEHADIYPESVRKAGRQAVATLRSGVRIFTERPENNRQESRREIREGVALWNAGREARLVVRRDLHRIEASAEIGARVIPWIAAGFLAHAFLADRRVTH